jgi:hypothetical protein
MDNSERNLVDQRERLHRMLIENLYSNPILNNSHRGDFIEMLVLDALGPEWRYVGLGWNLWDIQRDTGKDRARIQVKQCAALQLWGKTKRMIFHFPWSDHAPAYIRRDFPNEALENDGWFCDLFVVGVHAVEDEMLCDQTDPSQWQFMIVPSRELKRGQSSMTLSKAMKRWPLVPLVELKSAVETKPRELPAEEIVEAARG